jgi:hypothetical protein
MKGFFFLSEAGLSIGFLILFSLFLRSGGLALLFDPPEIRGDDLCEGSTLPFRRLPTSEIEFTDHHQGLAALEEVKIKLSQFSDSHDGDSIPASLPCPSRVQGFSCTIAVSGLTRWVLRVV